MSQFNQADPNNERPEPVDESQKTMSLMGGIVRAESLPEADELGGASGGRMLGQGTMLLLLVAAVAVGSIYLMRLSQAEVAANKEVTDAEARVEKALAKLGNPQTMVAGDPLRRENMDSVFQDTDTIVAMFTADMTKRQVPVDQIQKDPFELVETETVVPVTTRSDEAARRAAQERQRQQQMGSELSQLKLQSVMQGRVPVAVINGEFVRVGQTLGSFTVRAIDGLAVELEADGQVYRLTMQDDALPSSRTPRR